MKAFLMVRQHNSTWAIAKRGLIDRSQTVECEVKVSFFFFSLYQILHVPSCADFVVHTGI